MTTGRRIALLAAVIVIAVVGFIVLKPDDSSDKQTAGSGGSAGTTTTDAGKKGTKTSKPAPPPVPQVKVQDGQPAGGIKTIQVSKGDHVRFSVVSDVADEVHVHGFDLMKDVEAGGKVSFDFKATMDGVYEVELESRAVQIAKLEVDP